jgi:hypothetical protein
MEVGIARMAVFSHAHATRHYSPKAAIRTGDWVPPQVPKP